MKYLLFCLTLCSSVLAAQETRLITKDSAGIAEEYYVLTSNEKILHGTYVKYKHSNLFASQSITVLEAGSYKNGLKDGEWQYFHKGPFVTRKNRLWQQGSYVLGRKNGVWKEYYADTIQANTQYDVGNSASVDVVIDHDKLSLFQVGSYLNDRRVGEWVAFSEKGEIIQRYNVSRSLLLKDEFMPDSTQLSENRPAIYFGGKQFLRRQLMMSLGEYLAPMFDRVKDVAIVKVVLQIDEKGNLVQWAIQESNTKPPVNDAILKSLELLNKTNWIPALENGIAKPGRIIVTYAFTRDKPESFREKRITFTIFVSP